MSPTEHNRLGTSSVKQTRHKIVEHDDGTVGDEGAVSVVVAAGERCGRDFHRVASCYQGS
jgi:hypothetical protein